MGCNNWGELQCVNMFEVCRVFPAAGRCRGTREVTTLLMYIHGVAALRLGEA
jgi:hypothetical protein